MTFFCACSQPSRADLPAKARYSGAIRRLARTAFAVSLLAAAPACAASLTGQAEITDADSLVIQGRKIRLAGIDAPELNQPCRHGGDRTGRRWYPGREGRAWLQSWIADRAVTCSTEHADRYGRTIATCFVGGDDIGRRLVAEGWAWAYTRYSTRYVDAEAEAAARGLGVHAGRCPLTPEAHRHGG